MIELTEEQLEQSYGDDPFNLSGIRNQHNTPLHWYNCGGFALKTFTWLTPYTEEVEDDDDPYTEEDREEYIEELLLYGASDEYLEDRLVRADIDQLLKRFDFLQQINLEDAQPNDLIIAYRVFVRADKDREYIEDTDFHFKVRLNGFWFEKMGGGEIHLCELNPDKPWSYMDSELVYSSPIFYLRDNRI